MNLRRFSGVAGAAPLVAIALIAAACSDVQEAPVGLAGKSPPIGSGFDFYVLSLSWSPSYCEAEGADANRQQCSSGRPYAFIVHGLWPQFEKGFPESCETDQPLDIPDATLRDLYPLMPSAGLIRHQWRKHGTCSGLSREDYFATLRAARARIAIPKPYEAVEAWTNVDPEQVEADFIAANDGLPAEGVAVTCDRKLLREVRLCMTKELGFRPCPEVDRRACRADRVAMPPVRGG